MNNTFEITEGKLVKVNDPTLPALPDESRFEIIAKYSEFVVSAVALCEEAGKISVTSETDTAEMAKAKDLRKKIQKVRTSSDALRKELKDESLRKGQFIDAIYREIEKAVKPVEKALEESERYAEIQQERRRSELEAVRLDEIRDYLPPEENGSVANLRLGEISEQAFSALKSGLKAQAEEREKFAEEQRRKQKEEEEARERESKRIREENDRLRAQAEVDRKAREEAEAKLRESQISAKASENAVVYEANLAKTVDEYVKKYGNYATCSLLCYMVGTIRKQYDDEERLETLIENELEWKANPKCFD